MLGLGLLTLRLIVGFGFIAHGLPKLVPVWDGSPSATAVPLASAGLGWPYLVTVGAGLAETLGGLLLVAGAYTPWAALVLAAPTAAIGAVLYLPHGYFLNWSLDPETNHGYEFHLLRIATLVCLMMAGPGTIAYDARRKSVVHPPPS